MVERSQRLSEAVHAALDDNEEGSDQLKTQMLEEAVSKAKDGHQGKMTRKGLGSKGKGEHFEHRPDNPHEAQAPVQTSDPGVFCALPEIVEELVSVGAYRIAGILTEGIDHTPWAVTETEVETIIAQHYLFAAALDPSPTLLPQNINPGAQKLWREVFQFYGDLLEVPKSYARRWAVAIAVFIRRCARKGIAPFLEPETEDQDQTNVGDERVNTALTDYGPEALDEITSVAEDQDLISGSKQPQFAGAREEGGWLFSIPVLGKGNEGVYDVYVEWTYPFSPGSALTAGDLDRSAVDRFLADVDYPLHAEPVSGDQLNLVGPVVDGFQTTVHLRAGSRPGFLVSCRVWLTQDEAAKMTPIKDNPNFR